MKMKSNWYLGLDLGGQLNSYPELENLEVLSSWEKASEIEQSTWTRAADLLDTKTTGGMHTLVEELIRDRAFEHQEGLYLDPRGPGEDLVYAARRLEQAGMKVVLLDWDMRRSELEEQLSSDIPVIDIHPGADVLVHQGKDELDWQMTITRAAELMAELEGVEVIIFIASQDEQLEQDLGVDDLAMSALTVGRLAGTWGASLLVSGGSVELYAVLAGELELAHQERL